MCCVVTLFHRDTAIRQYDDTAIRRYGDNTTDKTDAARLAPACSAPARGARSLRRSDRISRRQRDDDAGHVISAPGEYDLLGSRGRDQSYFPALLLLLPRYLPK